MSITPRKPPRATSSDGERRTGAHPRSTRVVHRLWRVGRAMAGWVSERVRGLAVRLRDDPAEPRRGRDPAGIRRGPDARIAGTDQTADDRDDGPAGLPGSSGPAGPELPPRPDLEATETEDGLELSQPDREGAFVTSDEWEKVRP